MDSKNRPSDTREYPVIVNGSTIYLAWDDMTTAQRQRQLELERRSKITDLSQKGSLGPNRGFSLMR